MTVVKKGVPPLLYLSEVEQTIRVIDQSAGKILAETTVRPRTIVRVDQRTGVVAGAEELVVGPLPAGRRYAIVIVPDGANVSRTGSLKPTRRTPDPDAGAAGEE